MGGFKIVPEEEYHKYEAWVRNRNRSAKSMEDKAIEGEKEILDLYASI